MGLADAKTAEAPPFPNGIQRVDMAAKTGRTRAGAETWTGSSLVDSMSTSSRPSLAKKIR